MCSKTVESILEFRNRQLPYLCQDDEVKPDTTFHKCLPLMLTVGVVCNLDPPEQCDCCFHQQSGEAGVMILRFCHVMKEASFTVFL